MPARSTSPAVALLDLPGERSQADAVGRAPALPSADPPAGADRLAVARLQVGARDSPGQVGAEVGAHRAGERYTYARAVRGREEHAPQNAMSDAGRDRALLRPLQRPHARAARGAGRGARPPTPFPEIEDTIGWPRRRIASVLGGVSRCATPSSAGAGLPLLRRPRSRPRGAGRSGWTPARPGRYAGLGKRSRPPARARRGARRPPAHTSGAPCA